MIDWSKVKLLSIYPNRAGYRKDEFSREAASKVNPTLKERQKAVLTCLTAAKGGLTVDEVAGKLSKPRAAIAPRITELKELGYIRKSGRKGRSTLGGSCNVWEVKEVAGNLLHRW